MGSFRRQLWCSVLALLTAATIPTAAATQGHAPRERLRARPARSDSTGASPAYDPALRGLRWRLVGPFRGGRAVALSPEIPRIRSASILAPWTAASGRQRTLAQPGKMSGPARSRHRIRRGDGPRLWPQCGTRRVSLP